MKKKPINEAKESGELKNQLARALADYQNLTKRVEDEKGIWLKYSSQRVLLKLLPVLDNLESAQKHLKDQGLAIAISDFKNLFKEEDLEEIIPSKGSTFDHSVHEVIETVEGGKKGEIDEVVLPGWKFTDGKVIRFAKVKVYSGEILN